MKQLANLLETLIFNYSTNKKIEIIEKHLHKIAKDDRGYTIAFLLEKLKIKNIKRSVLLNIVRKKIDSELFILVNNTIDRYINDSIKLLGNKHLKYLFLIVY